MSINPPTPIKTLNKDKSSVTQYPHVLLVKDETHISIKRRVIRRPKNKNSSGPDILKTFC